MKLECPKCEIDLPARQMNVEANIAVCERCDEAFVISELLGEKPRVFHNAGVGSVPDSFDINQPPSGVQYDNHGMGWRIASTTRSAAAFFSRAVRNGLVRLLARGDFRLANCQGGV